MSRSFTLELADLLLPSPGPGCGSPGTWSVTYHLHTAQYNIYCTCCGVSASPPPAPAAPRPLSRRVFSPFLLAALSILGRFRTPAVFLGAPSFGSILVVWPASCWGLRFLGLLDFLRVYN